MTTADETPAPYGWVRRGNVLIYPGNLDADYGLLRDLQQASGRRRYGEAVCGTYSAYVAHYRDGQKPCDDCRAAATVYKRDLRRRHRLESA